MFDSHDFACWTDLPPAVDDWDDIEDMDLDVNIEASDG